MTLGAPLNAIAHVTRSGLRYTVCPGCQTVQTIRPDATAHRCVHCLTAFGLIDKAATPQRRRP